MTNLGEAKCAREAEIAYATLAMVTDYDSWHEGHEALDVATVLATLKGNGDKARALVRGLPERVGAERDLCPNGCDRALDHAVMTAPDRRDRATLARLDAVAGRVLG